MSTYMGEFLAAQLDDDGPDGTYLRLVGEDGEARFRVTSDDIEILDAVLQPLRDWQAELKLQKAAYDRATDAERAQVLGRPYDEGLPLDDPDSAGYADRLANAADSSRKAVRERA